MIRRWRVKIVYTDAGMGLFRQREREKLLKPSFHDREDAEFYVHELRIGEAHDAAEYFSYQVVDEPEGLDKTQLLVEGWVTQTFGKSVMINRQERVLRVAEEAIELLQAEGVDSIYVFRILSRVYSRKAGDPKQEAAGVGVTLLAWAGAAGVSLADLIDKEVQRIHEEAPSFMRAKQNEKAAQGIGMGSEVE